MNKATATLALLAATLPGATLRAEEKVRICIAEVASQGLGPKQVKATRRRFNQVLDTLAVRVKPGKASARSEEVGEEQMVMATIKRVKLEGVLTVRVQRQRKKVRVTVHAYDGTSGQALGQWARSFAFARFPDQAQFKPILNDAVVAVTQARDERKKAVAMIAVANRVESLGKDAADTPNATNVVTITAPEPTAGNHDPRGAAALSAVPGPGQPAATGADQEISAFWPGVAVAGAGVLLAAGAGGALLYSQYLIADADERYATAGPGGAYLAVHPEPYKAQSDQAWVAYFVSCGLGGASALALLGGGGLLTWALVAGDAQ